MDARARRVFELMGRACDAGVYPYQLPLEGRSGPWVSEGREFLMLSSYDYLGLIGDPRIDDAAFAAIRKYGTGTGGVRMLTGTIDIHHEMEREVADFKGMPDAITFSSGYLANLAVLASLLSPQDRVILDSLSHRSLVDACRLAGVPLQRFRHNDMDSLRQELAACAGNRTLIISDGVFSMDGDICPLPDLVADQARIRLFPDDRRIPRLRRAGRARARHRRAFRPPRRRCRYLDRFAGQGHSVERRLHRRFAGTRDLSAALGRAVHLLRRAGALVGGRGHRLAEGP